MTASSGCSEVLCQYQSWSLRGQSVQSALPCSLSRALSTLGVQCSIVAFLRFLTILPWDLWFISEGQWDNGANGGGPESQIKHCPDSCHFPEFPGHVLSYPVSALPQDPNLTWLFSERPSSDSCCNPLQGTLNPTRPPFPSYFSNHCCSLSVMGSECRHERVLGLGGGEDIMAGVTTLDCSTVGCSTGDSAGVSHPPVSNLGTGYVPAQRLYSLECCSSILNGEVDTWEEEIDFSNPRQAWHIGLVAEGQT